MEVEKQCRIIFSNYFYLVYERYGVAMPDKADWGLPQLPAEVPWLIAVEVPRMLMELGEMSKETHVPAMLKLCEYFTGHVDDSNYLDMYTTAISVGVVVLDHDSFLGKIQVYCAFSVGYCIYLCKHNMGHHAVEIYKTAQEKFQARFKFWLDNRHSWKMFVAEGRRMLREKQISDYKASLIRKSVMFAAVSGGLALYILLMIAIAKI